MNSQSPADTSSASSSSSHVRQEQIDQLRSRVDSVLRNLVQGTEADTLSLKSQVQALRCGPNTTLLSNGSLGNNNASGSTDHDNDFTAAVSSVAGTVPIQNTTNSKSSFLSSANLTSATKKWIVDPYGDQGEYEGEMNEDKLPHGFGIMNYTDGRIYQGGWKNGQWHGQGKATFSNGDMFEGIYSNDQRHGEGVYKWSDGRVFKGGFVNDQRSGQGEYRWPDGARYVGEFQNGLRHGEGTYTFHDGSVYSGEWQQGKYHGSGECHWADGRVYKGNWVAGKASGYGVEIRPDGSIRHDGQWVDDKPIRKSNTSDFTTKSDEIERF